MAQDPKESRFFDASAAVTGRFWRKMAFSTALSGSLFIGSVPLQAEAADAPPPSPQTQSLGGGPEPQIQLPDELMVDVRAQREEMRRIAISETLIIQAQKNFDYVAPLAQNDYSRGLLSLQSRLTGTLLSQGGNPNVHDRVVFLDPVQFDTARALGMEPQNAVRALLALAKATADDAQVDALADHMSTGRYDLRYDLATTTQDPAAIYNSEKMTAQACVVVPSSDYMPIVIPGITAAERVDFTNRHEGWHCLDTRYLLQGLNLKGATENITTAEVLASPDLLKGMSLTTRKESLADVGAVGDMIRQEGKGLEFLDAIRDWRRGQARDVSHMSVLVLQGLRDAITGMGGVEAFRAMDEKKMEDFYFAINERYGMQPKAYEYALRLDAASESMRGSLTRAFGGTQEFDKAVAFRALYTQPQAAGPAFTDKLTPQEQATLRTVTAFDARKKLEDEAFKANGKITPATLIAAYGRMQGRFQEELARNPDNTTTPALMGKLQGVFVQDLTHIDYLATNAKRGVNLVNVEPSLAAFRTPYKPGEPQAARHNRNNTSTPKP
ncbi:MAG: hypothetical protein PW788_12890 [Micavibrio sp.]|nr:hypothetical protein [Micavibrio sp.]